MQVCWDTLPILLLAMLAACKPVQDVPKTKALGGTDAVGIEVGGKDTAGNKTGAQLAGPVFNLGGFTHICNAYWSGACPACRKHNCGGWSSAHGVVVNIPAGHRICKVTEEGTADHLGAALFRTKTENGRTFVDSLAYACAGPFYDRYGSSIHVTWQVYSIPEDEQNPACDYVSERYFQGHYLVCN